jgi:hypothetical protein
MILSKYRRNATQEVSLRILLPHKARRAFNAAVRVPSSR